MYEGTWEEQVGEKLSYQLELPPLWILPISSDSSRWSSSSIQKETHAPGTRTKTFFPVNFEKLILSSMSLILISTSGTLSPALIGEAEAKLAKAEWAVEAAAEMIDADYISWVSYLIAIALIRIWGGTYPF